MAEITESQIQPLGDRVVIRIEKAEMKTRSGIIIPTGTKQNVLAKGKVVALGNGKTSDGNTIDMSQLSLGDTVLFPDWAATDIPTNSSIDSDKLVVVKFQDISSILEVK